MADQPIKKQDETPDYLVMEACGFLMFTGCHRDLRNHQSLSKPQPAVPEDLTSKCSWPCASVHSNLSNRTALRLPVTV